MIGFAILLIAGSGMNITFAFAPNITQHWPPWVDLVTVWGGIGIFVIGFALLFWALSRNDTNIELSDAKVESRPLNGTSPNFAVADFKNEPIKDYQKIEVRVGATIKFQDKQGNNLFNTMQGRWSNSLERSLGGLSPNAQRCLLCPDEIPEPLLIAIKHKDHKLAYGLNWDNQDADPILWTDKRKEIPVGTHYVTIQLAGENVNSERKYRLELTNPGEGGDLTLKKLCSPRRKSFILYEAVKNMMLAITAPEEEVLRGK